MAQRSLKRDLALWLTAVLSAVLLIDAWYSYSDALNAANQAYDRSLAASLKGIAERIHATESEIAVDIPYAALELVESRSSDRVFYSVGLPGAAIITGYEGLPQPPSPPGEGMQFYDGHYKGQAVRVGALLKPLYRTEFPKPVLVLFGETIHSREEVARTIFLRDILRKALLIVVALVVALLAARRAVKPIEQLGKSISARPDEDLRPVEAERVPKEVAPLVEAINLHMGRIDRMLESRRRFITDAAHQLRTPLAVLNTQAEYALRQDDPAEMRAATEAMHTSLGAAIHLTNQLLSLSRAEPVNGLALSRQPVDLQALVREVVIELLPLAARKEIDLGCEGTSEPLMVSGHALMLREMVSNLLDNALRYTPTGGMVTARVERRDGQLLISVLDNGPGVPAEFRETVFKRFFRLDSTDSAGSGLGLAIVREIVLGHGGEIRLLQAPQPPGLLVEVRLPAG